MTDKTNDNPNAPAVVRPPVLPVGGNVTAIIPQSLEEIFRVADGVLAGGFAPAALLANKTPAQQKSAIAVAIMAGAELGMPPMASLRSFTVIGGRPALFGDGLINVIRRSGRAEHVRTGFTPGKKDEFGDDAIGWCEAKRGDTSEVSRVEFSVGDAKRAGLWDDRERTTNRFGKEGPNEAPWHRYPKRMLAWRAAGYCLRELFGDVLGGLTDEYEAREIAQSEGLTIEASPPQASLAAMPPSPPEERSADDMLNDLEALLKLATTPEAVDKVFDGFDVQLKFAGNSDALASAFDMKKARLEAVTHDNEETTDATDAQE